MWNKNVFFAEFVASKDKRRRSRDFGFYPKLKVSVGSKILVNDDK